MLSFQRIKVSTLLGQNSDGSASHYLLVITDKGATLRGSCGLSKTYPSVERALHVLGGIVSWERWTAESSDRLNHLNSCRGAI